MASLWADTVSGWMVRWERSIRKRGVGATLRLFPAFLKGVVKGDPEKRFDRRYGVDTAGIIKSAELLHDPRYKDSNGYGPTSEQEFRRMLRDVPVDYREFTFVDFGCGKGKAMLLACGLPFREVIGVELWPEMADAAEENLKRYRGKRCCTRTQLHRMDAAEFTIPAGPGIYYFFDPFLEDVMRKVLANLRRSFVQHPRESYVLYCEPGRPDILDACDFLALVERTEHYCVYRTTGAFAR